MFSNLFRSSQLGLRQSTLNSGTSYRIVKPTRFLPSVHPIVSSLPGLLPHPLLHSTFFSRRFLLKTVSTASLSTLYPRDLQLHSEPSPQEFQTQMSTPTQFTHQQQYKLIWYAPDSDVEPTKNAVFKAGAGGIGDYEQCAWQVKGLGQFRPNAGANPTIGKVGTLETVEEWRVEVIVPHCNARKAIKALVEAHSYEEPAYELVKILTLDDFPADSDQDDTSP